ncbi:AraC family transcriptional regulator [Endobacterium cereale]|uniref:AraC family transcriptional regulator n=1 Tax=Endobacterium cereale TaxID=2663029 RepID=UPI002B4937B8|nr:AraC family transcriptional regulator [Endobacterium cereale]MEB2848041.1 AraC family transcriptional regulator [Endobacterium cereale]
MAADPLSDVLRLTKARGVNSAGLRVRGKFSVRVEAHEGMKFNAITEGSGFLRVDGGEVYQLDPGDCFLLTKGLPFTIGNDLSSSALPAEEVFANATDGFAVLETGSSPEVSFLGGKMTSDQSMSLLTAALPAVLLVRRTNPSAVKIRWLLDSLKDEIFGRMPGSEAMSEQIMHMIFIEMIRIFPKEELTSGWLAALSDRKISKAVQAIHSNPGRKWRLHELASLSGLSRSQFAARFAHISGEAPLEYLTRWRMTLARDALIRRSQTIPQVAQSMGYSSEAAFGAAFKRIFGLSPRRLTDRDRALDTAL